MIVNYNAGLVECHKAFRKKKKQNNPGVSEYNYSLFLNKFYLFLKEGLFSKIYKKDLGLFLEKVGSELTLDDAKIKLTYFTGVMHKNIIKVSNKRWSISEMKKSSEVDSKQTSKSTNANVIQGMDAELLRYIVNRNHVSCVHDSFGFSLEDTCNVMDCCNRYFQLKLKTNTYSMFILL